jgi:hypothetical protein
MAEPQAIPRSQAVSDILGSNLNLDIPGEDDTAKPAEEPAPEEVKADEAPADEPSAEEIERVRAEEADARDSGWVSWEEWTGDPKKWRPAAEYLQVRDHILPVVQRENKELRARLLALENRQKQDEQAREQRAHEIERETLRMELRQARTDQDWDRADEIMDKMFDLKLKTPKQVAPSPQENPEVTRAFQSTASANPWLAGPKQDKALAREFVRQCESIERTKTYDDPSDMMRQAVSNVRRLYPEKFRTRPNGSIGDTGGEPGPGIARGRTWNDIRPEVRKDLQEIIDNSVGNDGKPMLTRDGILKNCGPDDFIRR